MSKKKYIAVFTLWNGEEEQIEVQEEWIEGIAFAVEGQFFFASNKDGFSIDGARYANVKVYEVAA